MNYLKTIGTFLSSNKHNNITYYIYKPSQEPKAIVQISHGMCEYIERYESFIEFLAEQNILVCGNDHLGHKNSIRPDNILGYFAPEDGWKYLAKDLAILTKLVKKQYPNTPYYLFGHSMGSFVARLYLSKYYYLIDGAIISGTSGTNPLIPAGMFLAKSIHKIKGPYYRSDFIQTTMFGKYNNQFESTTSSFDWLTRDCDIVRKYEADSNCNFIFTTSAFIDLIQLLSIISTDKWYNSVPSSLPILIMSGSMDPLGNYGKGILEVYRRLLKRGIKDLTIKLYPKYRHELLNEIGKEVVYQDILNWITQHIN